MNDPLVNRAITQLKQRNIDGLELLVKTYQVRAVRVAYLIVGDQVEAEDVAQKAFLQVYAKIEQYDDQRPFEPWFMRIVANFALQVVRKPSQETSLDAPMFEDTVRTLADLIPDNSPLPEEVYEQNELREKVRIMLDALPPNQRAAIIMRYYLGMTEKEMAQSISIPSGTIKWRLHEARRQLRRLLEASFRYTPLVEEDTTHE
ncbi:sigma-70 family RNA polymerase sigma factor [bacterium]|nr:sigma-70 family RNA polymerase sigma factor [bacterium]